MFGSIGIYEAIVLALVIAVVYFVPSVIAFRRGLPNRVFILAINLLFGSTLIGWAVALYLATRPVPEGGRVQAA
ncbi:MULTISPECIES: superinfection immunity protein [Streptomyces]|uniref:Superinfection immunity protein n=1 Tax=Streptomyces ramulosus TaxID=47762 RepID=A0ABW1FL02_9ACTN